MYFYLKRRSGWGGGVGGPLEHLQASVVEDLYIKQVTHSLVVIQVEAVVQTCVRKEKYDQDGERKKRLNDGKGFSGPHNLQTSVLQSGQRGLQIQKMSRIPNITQLTIQMKGGKICNNRCRLGPEPSV